MTYEEEAVIEKVIEIVKDQFSSRPDKVEITLKSGFKKDCQADELDMVEMAMEMEDHFDTSIPDPIIIKWKYVADACSHLCNILNVTRFVPIKNRFEILDL